jgi:hypothetical protein
MVRNRKTYLSGFYWRLKSRRGAKKAIIAVSRKMLVIIYHMLKNSEKYSEEKFEQAKQKQEERRIKRVIHDAKQLGLTVTRPDAA